MPNCTYETEVDRVRMIGNDVRRSAETSTLELLRTVSSTVDALAAMQKACGTFENLAHQATDSIKKCKPAQVIDANNIVSDLLSAAEGALQVQDAVLRKQLAAAQNDPTLRGGNREDIVSEFKRSIAACADLHNAIVDMRWAIMEHAADLSPVSKPYTDVEELIKDLRS